MNETISELFVNGSIPLSVTVQNTTNWGQFALSALIALVGSFGILFLMYFPKILSFSFFGLKKLNKITKKNIILIKHTTNELFNQSMITQDTLRELSHLMNKMNGSDFDLILHTPGGEIFSSLAISRLIKQYPGKIRAIIPMYSMSGGSLIALSCKEIIMTSNACIGPIDPQLGSLFKFGSAKAWEKIVEFKGKKAEDQSISFAMMGKQYTKSIQSHLKNIIDFDLNSSQKEKFVKFLTDGNVEHSYPLTVLDLERIGIKVDIIKDIKFLKILSYLISSKKLEGVTAYINKKGAKRK